MTRLEATRDARLPELLLPRFDAIRARNCTADWHAAAALPERASAPSSSPRACPSPAHARLDAPRVHRPRVLAPAERDRRVPGVQVGRRVRRVLLHERRERRPRLVQPARVLVLEREPVARERIRRALRR